MLLLLLLLLNKHKCQLIWCNSSVPQTRVGLHRSHPLCTSQSPSVNDDVTTMKSTVKKVLVFATGKVLSLFALGPICSMEWNFQDPGQVAPWNFRSVELSLSGVNWSGNFHSLELLIPGTFLPGANWASRLMPTSPFSDSAWPVQTLSPVCWCVIYNN